MLFYLKFFINLEMSLLIPIIDGTIINTRKAVTAKPKTIVAAIGIKNCA